MEGKREGRKIPDVINGITGSVTKGKARAGPFEEDFSAEADLGPRKIQSWVPDEEEPSGGTHGQSWEDSQAYANPMAAYQRSPQGFQQGRIPLQQNKANALQQKQPAMLNGFPPQHALAGQNKQSSSFAPNALQQKTPVFTEAQQQGGQQQPPSAFQRAISAFAKPPMPPFSQPPSTNPAAPAFKPMAPAFQKTAPAFAKPSTGLFSQTAPAFLGGANASAASLGSGFSAKFGQSSAPALQSTEPQKLPTDSHLATRTPSPIPAFVPAKQQSHTPNQGFGYHGSEDQAGAAWQQECGWDQEGYYQGECGEEGYYEEHAGGDGDEDDEYSVRQADIARRQEEVAQMKAQVDAQLEEAKRVLAEKEAAAQQRKKDKKQSELRQSLLNHNFAHDVAQQDVQQQKSIFDMLPQQPPIVTPLPSFSAEPSPSKVSAFGPPKGASSVFFPNFKTPQLSLSPRLENRISFDLEKVVGAERRSDAPSPEPNNPPALGPKPERELSPEPTPPRQEPPVLLEQFSLYG